MPSPALLCGRRASTWGFPTTKLDQERYLPDSATERASKDFDPAETLLDLALSSKPLIHPRMRDLLETGSTDVAVESRSHSSPGRAFTHAVPIIEMTSNQDIVSSQATSSRRTVDQRPHAKLTFKRVAQAVQRSSGTQRGRVQRKSTIMKKAFGSISQNPLNDSLRVLTPPTCVSSWPRLVQPLPSHFQTRRQNEPGVSEREEAHSLEDEATRKAEKQNDRNLDKKPGRKRETTSLHDIHLKGQPKPNLPKISHDKDAVVAFGGYEASKSRRKALPEAWWLHKSSPRVKEDFIALKLRDTRSRVGQDPNEAHTSKPEERSKLPPVLRTGTSSSASKREIMAVSPRKTVKSYRSPSGHVSKHKTIPIPRALSRRAEKGREDLHTHESKVSSDIFEDPAWIVSDQTASPRRRPKTNFSASTPSRQKKEYRSLSCSKRSIIVKLGVPSRKLLQISLRPVQHTHWRLSSGTSVWFRLPLEVRKHILRYLLVAHRPIKVLNGWSRLYRRQRSGLHPAILSVCKSIFHDAAQVLYSENEFLYLLRDDAQVVKFCSNSNRLHDRTIALERYLPLFRKLELRVDRNRTEVAHVDAFTRAIEILNADGANLYRLTVDITCRIEDDGSVPMAESFRAQGAVVAALKALKTSFIHIHVFRAMTNSERIRSLRCVIDTRLEAEDMGVLLNVGVRSEPERQQSWVQTGLVGKVNREIAQLDQLSFRIVEACHNAERVVQMGWFEEFEISPERWEEHIKDQQVHLDFSRDSYAIEDTHSDEDFEG